MTFSRSAFVTRLRGEDGYREGRDADGDWNNRQKFSPAVPGLEWSQNQAWCHTFVSWGAHTTVTGVPARDRFPITASCSTGVRWWKSHNRWTEYPVLGGPFYMGTSGQDHVGVVTGYDENNIFTIEGNTNADGSYQGNGVYKRTRPRRGPNSPYGYGIPQFDEPTVTADPQASGFRVTANVPIVPDQPKEAPVALSTDDIKKIANTDGVFPSPDGGTNPHWSLASYLREGYLRSREAGMAGARVEDVVVDLSRKVDALNMAVARLEGLISKLQLAGVEKAVTDAVTTKLESLHISVED